MIVRPGGPSRLGVLLLAQHTVNGTTGAIVERSAQPCAIQIANCKDPVDPIHVVHAKDIQSDVVVVAHVVPVACGHTCAQQLRNHLTHMKEIW